LPESFYRAGGVAQFPLAAQRAMTYKAWAKNR
jgi:hypothetical protein